MDILKNASAGTLESSDAYVEVCPLDTLKVEIESVVKEQFGEDIKKAVLDVLSELDVKNAFIKVTDRGALECVIRARVETAVLRSKEGK